LKGNKIKVDMENYTSRFLKTSGGSSSLVLDKLYNKHISCNTNQDDLKYTFKHVSEHSQPFRNPSLHNQGGITNV
jgi:hypothetical protein